MRLPQAPPKRARIEIVPMIDAIFFLLVFFMFSSLSMIKLSGLPAALPQAPGAGPKRAGRAEDAPHLMVVLQNGVCTVGGQSVAPAGVARSVQARLARRPESIVVLQARKGSGMQELVTVMDALNQVRLKDGARPTVLIATEPVSRPDALARP